MGPQILRANGSGLPVLLQEIRWRQTIKFHLFERLSRANRRERPLCGCCENRGERLEPKSGELRRSMRMERCTVVLH